MQKLSRKDSHLHVLRSVLPCILAPPSEMTLRSARDLEVICPHPKLPHAMLYGRRLKSSREPLLGHKYGFIHVSN